MSSHLENQEEASDTGRYRIGDLLVDVDARRVLRSDQEIHLTKLSFDTLVVLLRHAPGIVSKQQLMDEVWQGVFVEPDTVKKRITLLRESLADAEQQEPLIRVVRGRGYSINVPVERLDADIPNKNRMQNWRPIVLSSFLVLAMGLLALFEWQHYKNNHGEDQIAPSIAVMPFGSESNQVAPFFTELSNELSRQLQKSGQIHLISPDAIDAVSAGADNVDIAARLGVRYILSGVLKIVDSNLTLSVALFDSETAAEVWTENFQNAQFQETTNTIANLVLIKVGAEPLNSGAKPSDPRAYDLYLQARQHHAATDLSDDAERLYREAIDIDPRLSPAYAGLCSLLTSRYTQIQMTQDFEEAERYCHRAWTIDEQSMEVHFSLAGLYKNSGQAKKAREIYRKVLASNPHNYYAQVSLANTYHDEQPDITETLLRKLTRQHPARSYAYSSLQILYWKRGRYAEAVEQQRSVVRLHPNERTKRNLAANLMMAGMLSEAKDLLMSMLENDSEKTGAIQNTLGFVLFFEGDYAGAARLFGDGVDREPENPTHYRNLGDAIWHLDGKGEADPIFRSVIQHAKRHLEINPNNDVSISNLMVAYGSIGDSDQFQGYKDTLLQLQAADPQAHYDIAIAASRLEDMQTARLHAEKARDLGYSLALLRADPDIAASGASLD